MVFTYLTLTLTLPNPEFGDANKYNLNSISRENRHGEAIVYKDEDWPTNITRSFTFKTLTLSEVTEIENFLDDTAGLQVQLVDYNGETWNGYIVTTDPEFITLQDNCTYDVQFDFMGEKAS